MNYQDEFLAPFLSEAVEASIFYFFKNWWMKLKCPILLKLLDTMIQEIYRPFYPSEPFKITHFKMRHPVWSNSLLSEREILKMFYELVGFLQKIFICVL